MIELTVKNTLSGGLTKYFKKVALNQASGADMKAKTRMGLDAINFVVNGSSKESVVPPVLMGILRASGSVHVGSVFVGGNNLYPASGATPNKSHTDNPDTVTLGFNTSYAAKMHETDWMPGPVSRQSGDTGNKFLQKHLDADKEVLVAVYAAVLKKETGA